MAVRRRLLLLCKLQGWLRSRSFRPCDAPFSTFFRRTASLTVFFDAPFSTIFGRTASLDGFFRFLSCLCRAEVLIRCQTLTPSDEKPQQSRFRFHLMLKHRWFRAIQALQAPEHPTAWVVQYDKTTISPPSKRLNPHPDPVCQKLTCSSNGGKALLGNRCTTVPQCPTVRLRLHRTQPSVHLLPPRGTATAYWPRSSFKKGVNLAL